MNFLKKFCRLGGSYNERKMSERIRSNVKIHWVVNLMNPYTGLYCKRKVLILYSFWDYLTFECLFRCHSNDKYFVRIIRCIVWLAESKERTISCHDASQSFSAGIRFRRSSANPSTRILQPSRPSYHRYKLMVAGPCCPLLSIFLSYTSSLTCWWLILSAFSLMKTSWCSYVPQYLCRRRNQIAEKRTTRVSPCPSNNSLQSYIE